MQRTSLNSSKIKAYRAAAIIIAAAVFFISSLKSSIRLAQPCAILAQPFAILAQPCAILAQTCAMRIDVFYHFRPGIIKNEGKEKGWYRTLLYKIPKPYE